MKEGAQVNIPSGSHLSPLTLEAANSLLSPLSSHLGDDDCMRLLAFDALLNGLVVTKVGVWWVVVMMAGKRLAPVNHKDKKVNVLGRCDNRNLSMIAIFDSLYETLGSLGLNCTYRLLSISCFDDEAWRKGKEILKVARIDEVLKLR
ncbi:hypothetical protein M434DRAFT_37490 [Hypoxylon sp. CO27-5]|nr:hypothetical protein M434DRAFT_37490 [Hypoxylon sp. CO27-5]